MSNVSANPLVIPTSAATIYNSGALGTTPVKYPDAASSGFQMLRRVWVTNKHDTAVIAIGLSPTTTSPTFAAGALNAVAANEGIPVLPRTRVELPIPSSMSVWVVASAASTPVSIMAFDAAL